MTPSCPVAYGNAVDGGEIGAPGGEHLPPVARTHGSSSRGRGARRGRRGVKRSSKRGGKKSKKRVRFAEHLNTEHEAQSSG